MYNLEYIFRNISFFISLLSSNKVSFDFRNKMYLIPLEVIEKFGSVSAKNKSDCGEHIETLAYLVGYKSNDDFIGTHLVFPEQEGTGDRVDDKGKSK
jgi:hypothetical protein